jgi:hypothetical protein
MAEPADERRTVSIDVARRLADLIRDRLIIIYDITSSGCERPPPSGEPLRRAGDYFSLQPKSAMAIS